LKLITPTQTIDFPSLGYFVKTESYDLPGVERSSYNVIGRDGEVEFTNGLKNKLIRVILTHTANRKLEFRRYLFNQIKPALLEGGFLVFDYEPQIKWRAKVSNGAGVKFSGAYDIISIDFTVSPYGVNSFDEENLTWGDADIAWGLADMPWGGSQNTFDAADETIIVENLGNRASKPIIKITASGNATLTANQKTLILTGIDGTVYVNSEKMIAYDDLKANKMTLTNGVFLELIPGENEVIVTGSAHIEFIDKSRWV